MTNILYCYGRRNPSIGYCQGMNFLVAMLLHVLGEEESFWVLCQLMESLLPIDYYTIMTGVIIDVRCIWSFLDEYVKSISKHFKKIEFDLNAILWEWVVWLHSKTLSLNIVEYIWDEFFNQGISAIFKYGLAIFEAMRKDILKWSDLGEVYLLFKDISTKITDISQLTVYAKRYKITNNSIQMKRGYFREIVMAEYEELHRKRDDNVVRRNSIKGLKSKFLKKFHLFDGLMKTRGQAAKNSSVLDEFEEEVVGANEWNSEWPICLYDFLYKDKIKDHFFF